MDTSKIGVRYALALFSLAAEKNLTEAIREDFLLVGKTLKESPELQIALQNPSLSPSNKLAIMKAIFQGKVNELTLRFIELVIHNRRENYLNDITRRFIYLYRESKGLKPAEFVTAIEISPSAKEQVMTLVQKSFHTEVELTNIIEPSIIGGFVLTVGDQQIDASVASGLRKIKRELLQ